jgi:bacterial/archaeal transporter family protein
MTWLTWALLSAFFAAATAILAKIGVAGIDSNLATAIRTTVVLFFAWIVATLTAGKFSFAQISGRTWTFLILSGIATGLSWLCYFRALQLGPASKVAPIDKLSLVLVIIAAAVFLREPVSLATALGGTLVLTGVLVLALA